MVFAFRHVETGVVAIVDSAEGYTSPDWTALPDPPAGPVEWDGTGWIVDLGPQKRTLTDSVNAHAETLRNIYLTPGSGQAITYTRKEAEARAWSDGADPADFPFLSAEAAATDASIADVAALVIAHADAWVTVGAAIEGRRRGLVVAIDAAADAAELEAIDITAGWPG